MPRQLRIEYPGAIYHIMSRGDRKKDIYVDDVDRQDFLKPLAEACQKTGFQVHAYCLMRNHFPIDLAGEPLLHNSPILRFAAPILRFALRFETASRPMFAGGGYSCPVRVPQSGHGF